MKKSIFLALAIIAGCFTLSASDNSVSTCSDYDEMYISATSGSDDLLAAVPRKKTASKSSSAKVTKPPFEVTVVHEYQNMHFYRDTYVFKLYANGDLTGYQKTEFKDANIGNRWEDRGTTEFTGQWSKSSRPKGNGYQTVYQIDRSDRSQSIYLPQDFEYIWMCDDAWYYCRKFDTDRAMKVTSVKRF